MSRRITRALLGFTVTWCVAIGPNLTHAQARANAAASQAADTKPSFPALSDAETEQFLLKGRVTRSQGAGKGITGSLRATMTDGTITHLAHIQTIDESKREFRSQQGTEFNFRDYWGYNVAAYRIDRLIGLGLVPVSVERRWKSQAAAYTWWLDDVMMDEGERLKRKVSPPNLDTWNQQMWMLRLFDQLIANTDRNLGNLVITNDWKIWAIDHTRAFRTQSALKTPGNITKCDKKILAALKGLTKESVRKAVGSYLQGFEVDSLLKRRDEIVAIVEKRGDAGVFDWVR
jgi:hypothetical protein